MRLLTKYNRVNIVIAFFILAVSSISYYYIIRYILLQQIDRDLKVEEQEIFDFVKQNKQLPNASDYKGQAITFEKETANDLKRIIKSSTKLNRLENEEEPVRMLTFPVNVNGVVYEATVTKSQAEAEDLLQLIVIITGGIFLSLLVITSVINRFVLNKLWQPFYNTLEQLKNFNLVNAEPLDLPATNLSEFSQLNTSVSEMTKRVSHEFEVLKTFTENASHEMQTPLAIINSKLDLLLQNTNEKQAEHLQAIYNATGRLSKLNETLLLLTKIENEQYSNRESVNLKTHLEQKFLQFDELIRARNIRLDYQLENLCLSINKELADILLNNLLSNAIKHNHNNGYINCILTHEKFSISNSGSATTFEQSRIFDRFRKSTHSEGTGLGLAVVKQICEKSGVDIAYTYNNNEHTFSILFKEIL